MGFRKVERSIVVGSRFMSVIAVLGSLAGSALMFFLGAFNIYEAFADGLLVQQGHEDDQFGTAAVISTIEALDRFLIATVLLYFAYGVYALLLHPGESEATLGGAD